MTSTSKITPIYRVTIMDESEKVVTRSTFFKYEEDAQEYADKNTKKGCIALIDKYWLK